MTANECIKGRRSIRQFTDKPIAREVLTDIVESASYAPSWKNTQIVRYIAVEGALKDKIASECTSAYAKNGEIIRNAPLLIAVTFIKNRSGFERDGSFSTPKEGGWQMFDTGIATEAFCLAAYEQGLGSVILGIFDEAKAAALLSLPEDRELAALIPIGYPAEAPAAPKRKPVEDLLSYLS
ncbi:MAG: nitroreductase family protein [Lachnospiraceae bacterium]